MSKKIILYYSILFSIVTLSIMTLIGPKINIEVVLWVMDFLIIIVFWMSKKYYFNVLNKQNHNVVYWYLLWNIVSFFHGVLVAEGYWEWKGLLWVTMALCIPIVSYLSSNEKISQSILAYYIRFNIPLLIVFVFIVDFKELGYYLVPINLLILFLPYLTFRWKFLLISISLLIILRDLDMRSNVIKFGFPFVLLLIFYFRKVISVKYIELIRLLLIIAPIVFFIFAFSGIFNVFNMDEYVNGDYNTKTRKGDGELVEVSLKDDTRSFLYIEVIQSAIRHNSWLIGRSPARGNDTEVFADWAKSFSGKAERLFNEVAILNVFTWTGIIGVVLYLFVFYKASYLAVNRSNNIFCKMIGLSISFRWLFSWIEDINIFSLTTVMLWFTIGLCLSGSFRAMSDKEVKIWVKGIFDIKYRFKFNEITNRKKTYSSTPNLP
jgi:hypothetical protein